MNPPSPVTVSEPICTWVNCREPAKHPQHAKDGTVWANLCYAHVLELDDAITAGPPKILAAWVKAQGGAKAAAKRMSL
jgi:hypothetical protein